jgi:hypothetical protein
LVLGGIECRAQPRNAPWLAEDARIVSGRDALRAEAVREIEELVELHTPVAGRAGARGLAGEIRFDERLDDGARKERAAIEREVGEADPVRDAASVVLVFGGAAARVAAGSPLFRVVPEVERDADDLESLVVEASGRDRRVHPAAHRDQDPFPGFRHPSPEAPEPVTPLAPEPPWTQPCSPWDEREEEGKQDEEDSMSIATVRESRGPVTRQLDPPLVPTTRPSEAPSAFARVVTSLGREVSHGESLMHSALGARGGNLGAAELIALQAGVYRYAEAVDLTAKLVDHATTAVKTVIQGQ